MSDAAQDLREVLEWYRTYPVPVAIRERTERLTRLADSFDQPGTLGYDPAAGVMRPLREGNPLSKGEHGTGCWYRAGGRCDCTAKEVTWWRFPAVSAQEALLRSDLRRVTTAPLAEPPTAAVSAQEGET